MKLKHLIIIVMCICISIASFSDGEARGRGRSKIFSSKKYKKKTSIGRAKRGKGIRRTSYGYTGGGRMLEDKQEEEKIKIKEMQE